MHKIIRMGIISGGIKKCFPAIKKNLTRGSFSRQPLTGENAASVQTEDLVKNVTRGHGVLEEFLSRQRAKICDSLIPQSHRKGRILDIGCGAYPLFLSRIAFSEKYGLDKMPDGSVVSECRKVHGITLIAHEFEAGTPLPFEDGYFSVVTMLAVLEHIRPELVTALLDEIHRVLVPGGVYILTVPAPWTDRLLRTMAALKLVSSVEIEEHKAVYSIPKISGILATTGFCGADMKAGYFEICMNIWAKVVKK